MNSLATPIMKYKVTKKTQNAYDDATAWSSDHIVRFDPLYELNPRNTICVVDNNGQEEVYGCLDDGLLTFISEDTAELVIYSISKKEWLDKMKQVFG